ncbi:purine-binding chemotaxis protein CheW [Thiorhodococcus mannitoliphagus]|uniref:Purine-binding chemotaxis protein CheW n=1 Tax=Thiorhodococcus mannitoliphagus TaxID=329406 RepID=A0A6P1DU71_9GAMM|nr:chemotaxis protein CheW [Thiorhodococcus mannitoliphagus]NEX21010.1 purine-binding chemotaxis protein CheW [Thiorhodococcus mannitoliphagus]
MSTSTESGISEKDPLASVLEQRRDADQRIVEVEAATVKCVIFAIDDRLFAFPGGNVAEILPLTTIHFVPGCPSSLEGVINVRGDITSVIRLGDLLGCAHAPDSRRAAILLGQSRGTDDVPMRSGLRVDRVEDVLDIIEESIRPPTDTLPEQLRGLATGIFQHHGQAVIALDLERLFQDYRCALR